MVLINPNLKDRPASAGIMSVRGRSDRYTRLHFSTLKYTSVHFLVVLLRRYCYYS
jgi:hypothetical protein